MQLIKQISRDFLVVLELLSDEEYTSKLTILENQTIGQQARHVIEYWQSLADNYESKVINYANRKRDKNIETNKSFAIDLLAELQQQSDKKDTSLSIVSMDERDAFPSSYYRELDNVAEHIIHHAAIIKMAILTLNDNIKLPSDFGCAPSTISYKHQQCVQ